VIDVVHAPGRGPHLAVRPQLGDAPQAITTAKGGGSFVDVVGRDRELDRISQFLDALPRGFSALLIEGEAGIGKTTLWELALRGARERAIRVLAARPTEAEGDLSFAALVDLLDPVTDSELDELAEPQRQPSPSRSYGRHPSSPSGRAPSQSGW